jgi:hypothetical protein
VNHVPGLVGQVIDQWRGHGPDPDELVDALVQ